MERWSRTRQKGSVEYEMESGEGVKGESKKSCGDGEGSRVCWFVCIVDQNQ